MRIPLQSLLCCAKTKSSSILLFSCSLLLQFFTYTIIQGLICHFHSITLHDRAMIRCPTCASVIASRRLLYQQAKQEAKDAGVTFDELAYFAKTGLKRTCCRIHLRCYIDQHQLLSQYPTVTHLPFPPPYFIDDEEAQRECIDKYLATDERTNKRPRKDTKPSLEDALRATAMTTAMTTTMTTTSPNPKTDTQSEKSIGKRQFALNF